MKTSNRCFTCFYSKKNCLCPYIEQVDSGIDWVILMHPKEAKKQRIGTGRISYLSLKNARLFIDVNFDENQSFIDFLKNKEANEEPIYVLYPGNDALDVAREGEVLLKKRASIIVIDGTWPCAKKIMRLSPILQNYPRISFDSSKVSRFTIKEQPKKFCLSTIESVFEICNTLSNWRQMKNHHNLIKLLDRVVAFQKKCALDPNLQGYRSKEYTNPEERRKSLKWQRREVFFRN